MAYNGPTSSDIVKQDSINGVTMPVDPVSLMLRFYFSDSTANNHFVSFEDSNVGSYLVASIKTAQVDIFDGTTDHLIGPTVEKVGGPHVMLFARSGTTVNVFYDLEKLGSVTYAPPTPTGVRHLYIPTDTVFGYPGVNFWDVRVWSVALSDQEAFREMSSLLPVRRDQIVGAWPLDANLRESTGRALPMVVQGTPVVAYQPKTLQYTTGFGTRAELYVTGDATLATTGNAGTGSVGTQGNARSLAIFG